MTGFLLLPYYLLADEQKLWLLEDRERSQKGQSRDGLGFVITDAIVSRQAVEGEI